MVQFFMDKEHTFVDILACSMPSSFAKLAKTPVMGWSNVYIVRLLVRKLNQVICNWLVHSSCVSFHVWVCLCMYVCVCTFQVLNFPPHRFKSHQLYTTGDIGTQSMPKQNSKLRGTWFSLGGTRLLTVPYSIKAQVGLRAPHHMVARHIIVLLWMPGSSPGVGLVLAQEFPEVYSTQGHSHC